jgi:hypothetical protein
VRDWLREGKGASGGAAGLGGLAGVPPLPLPPPLLSAAQRGGAAGSGLLEAACDAGGAKGPSRRPTAEPGAARVGGKGASSPRPSPLLA